MSVLCSVEIATDCKWASFLFNASHERASVTTLKIKRQLSEVTITAVIWYLKQIQLVFIKQCVYPYLHKYIILTAIYR